MYTQQNHLDGKAAEHAMIPHNNSRHSSVHATQEKDFAAVNTDGFMPYRSASRKNDGSSDCGCHPVDDCLQDRMRGRKIEANKTRAARIEGFAFAHRNAGFL